MKFQDFELGRAADILVRELFKLKGGETFIITSDTETDPECTSAAARAAFSVGARPLVTCTATPPYSGRAGEPYLPAGALTGALLASDAWVEFNKRPIFRSEIYYTAMRKNKKLRHLCLPYMHTAMMTRVIGAVDYPTLGAFLEAIGKLTEQAKHVRMTSPAGCDVEFDNHAGWPVQVQKGYADTPGSHMLAGQVGWAPDFETINGTIVFDGSVSKVGVGKLETPIRLTIERGAIVRFQGGEEAKKYEQWMRSFGEPQMLRLAHATYGFHPSAQLTGAMCEDERVWGATCWGIGDVSPEMAPPHGMPAASHTDGICLRSSVWLDGKQVTNEGVVTLKSLLPLARKLGKA